MKSRFAIGSPERFDHHVNIPWRTSSSGAIWKNIQGYNVAIIEDHNESGKWQWRIADPQKKQTWSHQKFSSPEEAMLPALEQLAKQLG